MLYRVFGRKKYGKTEYCLSVLGDCVENDKKCYFIVPEQFSYSCEKKINDRIGNRANMNAEVLSFTRLCSRVFRVYGGISNSYLDSVGKILCMSRVLETLSDELCEYGKNAQDVGFAADAVHAVEEFSSYSITSRKIEAVLPEIDERDALLGGKLRDITLLSAAYKAELKSVYGTDGECLDMLDKVLSDNAFFKDSVVIIDSFYGFTPAELKIINHMIRQAENVYITFCTQKDDDDPIFSRANEAASQILSLAKKQNARSEDVCLIAPDTDDDISFIERNFASKSCLYGTLANVSGHGENIRIIKCKNQIDEAKCVASAIYSLISQNKGTHFRDIAVCARSVASYEGIIDVFLEKSDIPFTYSIGEDLLTKPVIAYILTCIDFVSSWKSRNFICLLKTGLLRLSDDECALLENYVRTWSVEGKRNFLSDWFMNPSGYVEEFSDKDAQILEKVNTAKEAVIDTVQKFSEDISGAKTCTDIASAVYRLMCDSSYTERISEPDDERFWNLTVKAIDEIVKVYGHDNMTVSYFAELFKVVINEYSIQDIPEKADSVLIGSVDLIRSETIKYMFVLGCNNEYFPLQKSEDSIFSDKEKDILSENGIHISSTAIDSAYDEFFLAYNIFCDPYEKLFVLYSTSDLDGKALRRSVLVDTISAMFPEREEETYPFADPTSNITTATALSDDMYFYGDDNFTEAAKRVLCNDSTLSEALEMATQISNCGTLSQDIAKEYFGKTVCSSPSRFESYSRCRFSYFNRHLLGIYSEKKAELDSISTGLISHKILELFVKELAESKADGRIMTVERAKARILELLEVHFVSITHTDGNSDDGISKRFRYLYNRLSQVLCALAVHLRDELAQSEFDPADYEVSIGISDDTIKSVPIDIKDKDGNIISHLRIVGQVDRVDTYTVDGKTYVRIIDYKTGHKVFRKDEISCGFNLQMLLYLYCIIYSETKKYGDVVVPAGVLYLPVRKPEMSCELYESTSEECSSELAKSFRCNGVLVEDKAVLDAMDKGITGRFIPASVTKSGTMDSRSKTEPAEELDRLLSKAAEVSGKLASLMLGGNIQTNPYKCVISSCEHCEYMPVCRLDRKNDNIRYTMEEVE